MSPLANSFIHEEDLRQDEPFFPLHAFVCDRCFLVQLTELESVYNIFRNYPYFSSFSETWLDHCEQYTEMIVERLGLNSAHQVIEVASNDGYLLQYFKERHISILGIEPAINVARVAEQIGIPTLTKFFSKNLALDLLSQGKTADLLIGNNVLAHVPNLHDFVEGLKIILKPGGALTMEFPHVLSLIQENQFDTIYHEHFSYFSLTTVEKVFDRHGLTLFDVEELPTHGGSLRIYARRAENTKIPISSRVAELRERERQFGLTNIETYANFSEKIRRTKRNLLSYLVRAKAKGKTIAAYGAPAKGNTLLNYCGIGRDFIDYAVDVSPFKQNLFMPGTHIPVYHPKKVRETKPDILLILPWNIKDSIIKLMSHIHDWGGEFLIPIPETFVVKKDRAVRFSA